MRSTRAGMTLVEILVAVSLLGLLAAGMVTALQTGVGAWRDVRERLTLDRKVATANALLQAQLAAVVPVVAQPARSIPAPEGPFFHGEASEMRFVSSYSRTLGVRGGLRIVELNVGRTMRGLRLILTESPYLGAASIGRFIVGMDHSGPRPRMLFSAVAPRADSLIAADQLESCAFEYLRPAQRPDEAAEWTPVWDDMAQIPLAIRIRMAPLERTPRLLPQTLVAQVRARYAPPANGIVAPDIEGVILVKTPHGMVRRRVR